MPLTRKDMTGRKMTGREALRDIRLVLADMLRGGSLQQQVADVYTLLDVIEGEFTPPRSLPKRGASAMQYSIERLQGGEMLTEHRVGGKSQPFRVPKSLYLLAAKTMAAAQKPLKFEELLKDVSDKASPSPGPHQVRAVLRFWQTSEPSLVNRARSRYSAPAPKTFARDAQRRWDELPKRP